VSVQRQRGRAEKLPRNPASSARAAESAALREIKSGAAGNEIMIAGTLGLQRIAGQSRRDAAWMFTAFSDCHKIVFLSVIYPRRFCKIFFSKTPRHFL
jgi:hypothetical protein